MDMNDFSKLQPTEHMLKWLAEDPYAAIYTEVEQILNKQVPGSQLLSFEVTSDPQWLTGGRRSEDNPNQVILVRTGVAFAFTLQVREPAGPTHKLHGVYSWVGTHLDEPANRKQRVWFDLDVSLETYGSAGELKSRLYFD
jgi:hypothetical protein